VSGVDVNFPQKGSLTPTLLGGVDQLSTSSGAQNGAQ